MVDRVDDWSRTPSPTRDHGRRLVLVGVVVAVVLGLVGVGLAAVALATMPSSSSGPQGPQGPQGVQGVQGVPGTQGPVGPAGSITTSEVVSSATLVSHKNPDVGTVLVAKLSCPTGRVLLAGGAQVSAPGLLGDRNVALRDSFPLDSSTWQTVAIVTGPLEAGTAMSLRPYVLCGTP